MRKLVYKQVFICTPSDSVIQLVLGQDNGPSELSWSVTQLEKSCLLCHIYIRVRRLVDIITILNLFWLTLFSVSFIIDKKIPNISQQICERRKRQLGKIIIILTTVSVFFYQWHSYFRFSVWSLSKIVSGLMDDSENILNGSYIETYSLI